MSPTTFPRPEAGGELGSGPGRLAGFRACTPNILQPAFCSCRTGGLGHSGLQTAEWGRQLTTSLLLPNPLASTRPSSLAVQLLCWAPAGLGSRGTTYLCLPCWCSLPAPLLDHCPPGTTCLSFKTQLRPHHVYKESRTGKPVPFRSCQLGAIFLLLCDLDQVIQLL